MLEVANFREDYLTFEATPQANDTSAKGLAWPGPAKAVAADAQGRYVVYNDSIHENSGADFNSLLSLGLVRCTFELAVGKMIDTLKGERCVMKTDADTTVVLVPEGAGPPVEL